MKDSIILAIDPGPTESAWLLYDTKVKVPCRFGITVNANVMPIVLGYTEYDISDMAIEMVACYGMAVGASVFETCTEIGKFEERFESKGLVKARRVYRKDVAMHLCNSMRAKDPNIRQTIMDRYGSTRQKAIGTKKNPGPLYGVSKHVWAALAVAITFAETQMQEG